MKINSIAVIFGCSLTLLGCAQQNKITETFKASPFTHEKSFTNGCEGPAVDKNGNVYAVNFAKEGTIGKVSPDGKPELFVELPQGSTGNGIRFNSKGDMFVADYTGHNVLKVDMNSKQVSVFAHEPTMSQPNDIAIDGKDRIYASDPNWKNKTGRFWRIDTDGKITLLDSLGTANGIEVSPDEKILYVNAGREIWAYDLSDAGEVSNKRKLIEFPDFGVDGMRCDVKGNIYIARFGKGSVAKISPKGYIIKEVMLTGKQPTNIAFGGKDGKTVYVTLMDQGNLESFRVDEPGREWQMQQDRN
ncbi:MAG TPA: SMP-30/gluconolactonase/LRE family protein [Flavitalea sp.]|nr:SMP-30/gluconolactonase/LRE family protein [Flavitalea sp.]